MDIITAKETSSEAKVQATHDPITISKFLQDGLCFFATNSLLLPPSSDAFKVRPRKAAIPPEPSPSLEQVKNLIRNKEPFPASKHSTKNEESLTSQVFNLTSSLGDFFKTSLSGILDNVETDGSIQIGTFEAGQLDRKQVAMRAVSPQYSTMAKADQSRRRMGNATYACTLVVGPRLI